MTEEQVLLRANGEIQVVLSGTVAIPVNHSQFAERESYETLAYCFGLVVFSAGLKYTSLQIPLSL